MEIIKNHNLKSREVVRDDLGRVKKDAKGMIELCYKPLGIKTGALAIAHCQITNKDPLRFFVLDNGSIIINPKIINKFGKPVRKLEGCMSFANTQDITIKRSEDIRVVFDLMTKDGVIYNQEDRRIYGKEARIYQHEIDHFEGINIYRR